jgi:HSP20 family molecular chaperone IbpA
MSAEWKGLVMSEVIGKKPLGIAIGVGLVMLLLGVAVGVGTAGYVKRTAKAAPAEKATATVATATPTVPSIAAPSPGTEWNPFDEMQKMQTEMDKMFQDSFGRLQASPSMDIFHNHDGYSLSLNVRDLKNRYEVSAVLPDTNASDANVTLKGNELEVSVTDKHAQQNSNGNAQIASSEWGRYDESVQLAGDLNRDAMKVERKNHELLITIPKA